MNSIKLFLFLTVFFIDNRDDIIIINNLKDTYMANDTVCFALANKTDSSIYYYIGIECKIDNEWREIITDINNIDSKSVLVSKLSEGENKEIRFSISDVLKRHISKFKLYRLKINYGSTVEATDEKKYSKQFEVNTM